MERMKRIVDDYLGWWIALSFFVAGLIWGGWYQP